MVAAHQPENEGRAETALRVQVRRVQGSNIAMLSGDLDLGGIPAVEGGIAEALAAPGGLVIDLAGLTFIGSEGMRVVLMALERAEAEGRPVRVIAGAGAARRLIDLLGLAPRLGIDGEPA